jgi:4-hydroxybenzoate polyprenyltransferase
MVREIVKDLEDAEGDKTAGCETLPIVIGAKRTIYIAGGLMVFTIIMLAFAQFILFQLNLTSLFWYFLFTVQAGAILFLVRLFSAREKRDYRFLSLLCKLIMVAGILSMGIMLIIN